MHRSGASPSSMSRMPAIGHLPGKEQYDLILDTVENRAPFEVRRALTPGETLALNGQIGAKGIGMLIRLVSPPAGSPSFARIWPATRRCRIARTCWS
jgi:hypothetical protein